MTGNYPITVYLDALELDLLKRIGNELDITSQEETLRADFMA